MRKAQRLQLSRIEDKLDRVLNRLQMDPNPSGQRIIDTMDEATIIGIRQNVKN